jgi:hypothetical protein
MGIWAAQEVRYHSPSACLPPEPLQTEEGARPGQSLGMEILNSHAAAAALAVQAFERKDERPIRRSLLMLPPVRCTYQFFFGRGI